MVLTPSAPGLSTLPPRYTTVGLLLLVPAAESLGQANIPEPLDPCSSLLPLSSYASRPPDPMCFSTQQPEYKPAHVVPHAKPYTLRKCSQLLSL